MRLLPFSVAPNGSRQLYFRADSAHARLDSASGELCFEIPPNLRILILVFDLRAALFNAAIDDIFKDFVFFAIPADRQVTGFAFRSIEVLMKPLIRG
jgi:hypothetical protein